VSVVTISSNRTINTAESLLERVTGRTRSEQPRASSGRNEQLGFRRRGSGHISGISCRNVSRQSQQGIQIVNTHVPIWPMKRQAVEVQAQEGEGEALWPFSCEVVVAGRFSKLDAQAREGEGEELPEEPDHQVVPVVPLQVAKDLHNGRDRVSYRRGYIKP
jgi:hypothetical protein